LDVDDDIELLFDVPLLLPLPPLPDFRGFDVGSDEVVASGSTGRSLLFEPLLLLALCESSELEAAFVEDSPSFSGDEGLSLELASWVMGL
jgi:hypothetical protein